MTCVQKYKKPLETNGKLLVEGNVLACFVQIYPFDSSSRGLNVFSIEIVNKKKK